jgi:pimeloyl-ACP methyl ester carboxylesterase
MPKPEPTPFQINVSEDLLQFITHRVATARIPPGLDLPQDQEWSYGIPPATVHTLRDYWATKYSWRDTEARINARFKMFTLPISESGETLTIHFVHHRSEREGAVPLLFQHGWPGNFLEVERIIDALTDPPGGQQAYHVVAPSLPGFAFSEGPRGEGFRLKHMAAVDHKLMLALGYGKYMAQGGDWGSLIVRIMALDFPESCVAVHVNAVVAALPCWWRYPLHFLYFWMWAPFQGSETALGRMLWWKKEETGVSYMPLLFISSCRYLMTSDSVSPVWAKLTPRLNSIQRFKERNRRRCVMLSPIRRLECWLGLGIRCSLSLMKVPSDGRKRRSSPGQW